MKKLLTTLLAISLLTACNKDKTRCYECNFDGNGYADSGCYTKEEWDGLSFTDPGGIELDKRTLCKTK